MEHEVTKKGLLLDAKGRIMEEGWARKPLWIYQREQVKGGRLRIKEWDYYAVINQQKQYAVTATMSDLGYAALFAISYIDFTRKAVSQKDALTFFPLGKIGLSSSSDMDNEVAWANKTLRFAFVKRGEKRHLMFACPSLVLPDGSIGLDCDFVLNQRKESESLTIATSWKEQRKAFYLNEKVNCMRAEGTIRRGMKSEQLLLGEAWGVLDWGRGRWTYQNTWYWASLSALVENIPFGLNLGYGFSDRTPASENAIYYNHKIDKLGEVQFQFNSGNLMEQWHIQDKEGRLDLIFQPVVDRSSNTNFVVIKSSQHQLFGSYSGTCKLSDGTTLHLDGLLGFAEEVFNRW